MSEISELLDVGGTPAWNAAVALIMLAAAAQHPDPAAQVPGSEENAFMGPLLTNSNWVVNSAISNAEANGFTSTKAFRGLVGLRTEGQGWGSHHDCRRWLR